MAGGKSKTPSGFDIIGSGSGAGDTDTSTRQAAASFEQLRSRTRALGEAFEKMQKQAKPAYVGIKEARKLFDDAGKNIKVFNAALKAAGTSERDMRMLTGQMNRELDDQRRKLLGMEGLMAKVFDPGTIIKMNQGLSLLGKGFGAAKAGFTTMVDIGKGWFDKQVAEGKDVLHKVVAASQYREDTMLALKEGIKGSDEFKGQGAKELYNAIAKMAMQTPLDTDYLLEQAKSLVVSGYTPEQTKSFLAFIADQQTTFKGQTGAETAALINNIKMQGRVSGRTLIRMGTAHINQADIAKRMAKSLGIVTEGKGEEEIATEFRKAVTKGKVGGNALLNAIMEEQEAKHGLAGSVALKNANTLSGVINNFENAFEDLMKTVDVTKWPGLEALKGIMSRIQTEITNTDGAGGRLINHLQHFADAVLGGLDKITDTDIDTYLDSIGEKLEWGASVAKKAWEWIDKIIHSGDTDSLVQNLKDAIYEAGKIVGKGLAEGFVWAAMQVVPWFQKKFPFMAKIALMEGQALDEGPAATLMRRGGDQANAIVDMVEQRKRQQNAFLAEYNSRGWGKPKAAAPENPINMDIVGADFSNVSNRGMGNLSLGSPGNLDIPHLASGGMVRSPTVALIGESGPEAVVPLDSGNVAGGPAIGEFNLHVSISGASAPSDPAELADMIADASVRKLTSFLERKASERG